MEAHWSSGQLTSSPPPGLRYIEGHLMFLLEASVSSSGTVESCTRTCPFHCDLTSLCDALCARSRGSSTEASNFTKENFISGDDIYILCVACMPLLKMNRRKEIEKAQRDSGGSERPAGERSQDREALVGRLHEVKIDA